MSLDASHWAWTRQGLNSSQRLILLSLADRADERHICWPSMARLAKDTCLDPKTIRKNLDDLCAAGLVRREQSTGQSSTYTLIGVPERHAAPAPDRRRPPAARHAGASGDPAAVALPAGGDTPAENGTSAENGASAEIGTPTDFGTPPLPKTVPHPCRKRQSPPAKIGTPISQESSMNLSGNLPEEDTRPPAGESALPPEPARARPARESSGCGKARPQKTAAGKLVFGRFGNVRLTQEEHDKLLVEFGDKGQRAVEKLDAFIGARGDRYKSHYMAMHSWVLRAVDEEETGRRPAPSAGRVGVSPQGNSLDGKPREYTRQAPPAWATEARHGV